MNPAERTLSYAYDKLGNLTGRTSTVGADSGLSGASFGDGTSAPGPNALTGATIGGDAYALRHDTGGKVLRYDDTAGGDDTLIGWNGRSLAETIDVASDAGPVSSETFAYGPDGARYHRKSVWKDGSATRTEHTFYAGTFEERLLDGHADYASVQKIRVGAGIVQVRTLSHPDPANNNRQTAASSLEYLHRDHLGSVEAVTDASGARLATLAYDPFGARRKPDWTRSLNSGEVETLADDLKLKVSRGYSDHEHLDRAGFIHMNGRVYDPRTGRFLSPDPIVENPTFSQSWHSYSYVANSPLSLADPTGLFAQCPIPTLGFSCDPAPSPGGLGGAIDTIFSFIHRYWFDFYVYRAPSFSLTFGDEGIDLQFDVVDLIGVAVSVASEIVRRDVRFEGKGEADDPSDTTPPIARVAKRMQAAAAAARRAAVLDERSSHEGFRTYLGCRESYRIFAHCYVVVTEDGEIYRQYTLSGYADDPTRFLGQGTNDKDNATFGQDRQAFESGGGNIFSIQPPEGVTEAQFKDRIIEAAEGYKAIYYDAPTINSNAAAGYVILKAGGTLPSRSRIDGWERGLRMYEGRLDAGSRGEK